MNVPEALVADGSAGTCCFCCTVCPKDEFGLSITSFLVSLGWEHINYLQGEKNESININIRLFKMFSGGQRKNVTVGLFKAGKAYLNLGTSEILYLEVISIHH